MYSVRMAPNTSLIAAMRCASSITHSVCLMPSSASTSATGIESVTDAIRCSACGLSGWASNTGPVCAFKRLDLAHPIVFLVWPGEFVLANAIAVVGGNRGHRHQPRSGRAHPCTAGKRNSRGWSHGEARRRRSGAENSRPTWHTPRGHGDRSREAGRSRPSSHAGMTRACQSQPAEPRRWKGHRRAVPPLRRHQRHVAGRPAKGRISESSRDKKLSCKVWFPGAQVVCGADLTGCQMLRYSAS
jgi:hypothetical protein